MGRGNRESGGGSGGGFDGSRDIATVERLPLPEQDSVIIGFGDDHTITYYSPRENKFLEVETDIEILVDGDEHFNRDYFQNEIDSLEEELLSEARRNLREKGEVGYLSGERTAETEIYLGPTGDRMDQRWEEGESSVTADMHIPQGAEIYDLSDDPRSIESINPPEDVLEMFHARKAEEAKQSEETSSEQSSADDATAGGIFSEEAKQDVQESLDGLIIRANPAPDRQKAIDGNDAEETSSD
jgi:hypothetical protein